MNNSKEYAKIEESWINNKEFSTTRTKYLINFMRGIEPGSSNYGIEGEGKRFIRVNDIGSNNKNNVYVDVETDAVCNKGDILLCLDGSPGITTREMEGVFSTGLRKLELREDKLDYDYLFYSLNCDFVQEAIQFFSKGTTIMHASDVVNYLKQPVPDLAEQKRIVNFLNEKTQEIDKIIKSKKKQIGLLKEYRNIIINEIFQKGIKKSEYKTTEIEWIEQMPVNWALKKLKYLTTKIGSGKTPKGGSEIYPDQGIIFIRSQNVYFDKLRLDNVKFISEVTHKNMGNTKVQANDLLLNITGASIGRIGIFPKELNQANVNQHVSIIRANEFIIPRYLQYFLYSNLGQAYIFSMQNGSSKEGLNAKEIGFFKIPLPKRLEQEKIIEFLNTKTDHINNLIATIKSEIEKIQEFKKILINDAVTGRVKVNT